MIDSVTDEIAPSLLMSLRRIIVVDSSVGVKWFINEENSQEALLLLNSDYHLIVPSCFYSEVTNVFWKRAVRGDITYDDGLDIIKDMQSIVIEIESSERIMLYAFEIAKETGQATYDCEFIAVAIRNNTKVVTADEKLFHHLSNHPAYGPYLIRLRDFKP